MSIAPSIHCISTSFAFNIERLWPIQSYGYVTSTTTRLYGAVELGLPLSRIIDDGAPVLRGHSTYRVVYWPYPHSIVGEHQYYIVMDQWRQWWWRRWLISMSVLPVLYQTDSAKLCAYDVNMMWMTRIIVKIWIDELIIMVISFLLLLELIRIGHYCYI